MSSRALSTWGDRLLPHTCLVEEAMQQTCLVGPLHVDAVEGEAVEKPVCSTAPPLRSRWARTKTLDVRILRWVQSQPIVIDQVQIALGAE
jgi:hypothetical protein